MCISKGSLLVGLLFAVTMVWLLEGESSSFASAAPLPMPKIRHNKHRLYFIMNVPNFRECQEGMTKGPFGKCQRIYSRRRRRSVRRRLAKTPAALDRKVKQISHRARA